ncbi:MAG: lysophospholipid acyltransferase family protein [Paludibacteraceae bacterium]
MEWFVKIISRIPLRGLYAFASWVLYPVMYYMVRYRRGVVEKNLRLSFPDLSEAERRQTAKRFYRSFADVIVEIVHGYSASAEEMRRRVVFENEEQVKQLIAEHGAVIVMLAHMGTWEWMADFHQHLEPCGMMQADIYRRLKNGRMDRLMNAIRSRRGGVLIEKQQVLRQMLSLRKEGKRVLYGFICDQKPRPQVTRCWTTFLHQDTGFLDGSEVLAKKFGYPVLYLHIRRPKRGYYLTRFDLISDQPAQEPENAITLEFARRLEQNIVEQPELWLWTHNRWKWGRQV